MARLNLQRWLQSLPLRVGLLGVLASATGALAVQRYHEVLADRRLVENAQALEARLDARVQTYLALLRGGVGLLTTHPELSRADFQRYVGQVGVEQHYPGIQGIGVARRVTAEELPAFEASVRRDAPVEFRVWPDTPRAEYHPIVYLEPQDARNRAALGYDMFTEPVRQAAMARARRTGRPAATGRVILVQEIEAAKQPGFLIYVPFYRGGAWPATEEERFANLAGFVYAPFRVGDFLAALSRAAVLEGVSVEVFDGPAASEQERLHTLGEPLDEVRARQLLRRVRIVDQTWTLVYSTDAVGFVSPWLLFVLGSVLSGGVALLVRSERAERRRADRSEAETREREGELALLVEAVPAAVGFVDRDGIFRVGNRRWEEWLGVDVRSTAGRPLREVLGETGFATIETAVARALRGESVSVERWHPFGRGGLRYFSTLLVPHRVRSGELNGFYALISDLTSLKRAEEAARFVADCGKLLVSSLDYEATARGVVHLAVPRVADLAVLLRVRNGTLAPVAVAHADGGTERRVAELAQQVTLNLGGTHNIATAARSGVVVVTPEVSAADLDRVSETSEVRALLQTLAIRSAMHIPIVVRGRIWAVYSLAALEGSGRRFDDHHRSLAEEVSTRVRLAVENALLHEEAQQEIAERRRAERAVQESEERFRLLVEGAQDYAIILLDSNGAVASWNQGAQRILGFGEHEAVGLPIGNFYTEEDRREHAPERELERARERGSALEERWYVRRDGTRFWASGHTLVLRTEDGQRRGYAKILRDLTHRKLGEEELEQRVRQRTLELNEAVQELEAFSYSVSHDLRAPLRSIRGFTDLALEEAGERLNAEERGYLARVQKAVARLDQLISDLLAYTRVSKTRVELGPVDLHALVSDLRREHPEFHQPRADVSIEGTLEPVVGNVAYLTQCLTNLIGNGVKFVRPGELPRVRLWTERRDAHVRLCVRDHGIGIAPENLGRVFEMFERLHSGAAYEGTGVGLAIVRRAVQRMNGTIGVESELGGGTTFWIELPAAPSGTN